MSRDFNKNKVAVLTGAAKKIGRSTSIKLAEQGFNILIHTGGKSIEEAKYTIKLLEKFKIKSNYVTGDLANLETINIIKDAALKLGTPSVLVNNAGINRQAKMDDVKEDDWDDF